MTAAMSGNSRVLEPGTRVAGKLKLLRRIAEGGMGAVWMARNVMTGANVAIKILHNDRKHDDHAAERFRHEAKLGATLAHRNITRVYDLLEDDDGSLVLVMELLNGETLRSYYQSKRGLSTREAVAIMVPVLSALQHAHDHNVVHRDLKPSNIILHVDSDGQMTPKLLDFGIAKGRDSSINTRTGDALGTPSYMSPEQVRAIKLDGRSDIFSVAVVLYEIIAGQSPFPGPTASAILAQVLELDIDPDPSIDPRVWIELSRALSKQVYQRHSTAREFATALCAAVGESEAALVQSLRRGDSVIASIEQFLDKGDESDPTERVNSIPVPAPAPAPSMAPVVSVVPGVPRRWPRATLALIAGAGVLAATGGFLIHASGKDRGASAPTTSATATATNAAEQVPATKATQASMATTTTAGTTATTASTEPAVTSTDTASHASSDRDRDRDRASSSTPARHEPHTSSTRRVLRPTPAPATKTTAAAPANATAPTAPPGGVARTPGF